MAKEHIDIIECPRDAMQGIKQFIPTEMKIRYINSLMSVGFHTIDFGSFVSPKAIPQMKDTSLVIDGIDTKYNTNLLAIVANKRGADDALCFEKITHLGYPFSISEIFQNRNTNRSIEDSKFVLDYLINKCQKKSKSLVVYLSMAFGNPYGEPWDIDIVMNYISFLIGMGVKIISLSDTIGIATNDNIGKIFKILTNQYSDVEFGAHLHVLPSEGLSKINSAFENGCRRFDGVIKGFGGCPMASEKLMGNLPTEKIINFIESKRLVTSINPLNFESAYNFSKKVFS
ncbi:MAG: hydroxymethylglutaryl-CoA lyase [Flavobacteriaceae bacterium]|nr:hydroxymethylglutaryl-CoA lyase [Flavobacteriaceae bacterium]|tara:strand:+ start:132 stop:989 length:858 start_codon:yes stop_codon:yes gene_type:complete